MDSSEDARLRLAYDEGFRALDLQREDLERMRARVVALISVGSLAVGVLAAFIGRQPDHRSGWAYVGLAAFAVLVVCVCVILAPHKTVFETDPRVILTYYVDRDRDISETLRWSAHYAGVNGDANRKMLERLGWVYVTAIVALGVAVAALTRSLVWRT